MTSSIPNAGFTEGPWSVSDRQYECNDYRVVIRSNGHELIATVGNMGATSDHKPTAKRWKVEARANARLIAAAPELYEALAECELLLRDLCPRIPHDGPRDAAEQEEYERIGFPLSRAGLALAKARGEA